jgi:plastocyanin domain-containing protein
MSKRTGMALGLLALMSLTSCKTSGRTSQNSTGGEQARVAITVDENGFHPDAVAAKAGQPVTLVMTRTSDQTCAKEVVIPSLSKRMELPLNHPVELQLAAQQKGDIQFACGMDMWKGVIHVE